MIFGAPGFDMAAPGVILPHQSGERRKSRKGGGNGGSGVLEMPAVPGASEAAEVPVAEVPGNVKQTVIAAKGLQNP